jgi:hypothetical protein
MINAQHRVAKMVERTQHISKELLAMYDDTAFVSWAVETPLMHTGHDGMSLCFLAVVLICLSLTAR